MYARDPYVNPTNADTHASKFRYQTIQQMFSPPIFFLKRWDRIYKGSYYEEENKDRVFFIPIKSLEGI